MKQTFKKGHLRVFASIALFLSSGAYSVCHSQTTASSAMRVYGHGPFVNYNISSEGVEQPVRWGIDTAWLWDWWPLRATNHMRECVTLGRVTLDPRVSGTYAELSADQKERLDLQLSWLKKSGVKDLYLLTGNASGQGWQTSFRTSFIKDIALGVEYLHSKGYNVTAISHFNEPDFGSNLAPGPEEMAIVARLMKENPTLKDIDVCGPSTLNPDYAYAWWDVMKNDIQIGNTHQLAGTFDNFAGFYAKVQASGKKSTGDEMHNINDALIGMNHGMSEGIWWSDFGGYTRAELGRASNDGSRIGYAENRGAWTSAAVFKRKSENLVEAFLGTSERQAGESAFTFLSEDRLAYYDGYGPYYDYTKATPGGTGYATGQTNSEYVIEITHGEDVPVGPINGNFKIVNKATGNLLSATSLSNAAIVSQSAELASRNQTWTVKAIDPRSSGDFSYVHIINSKNSTSYLDAEKYQASNGSKVMVYAGGGNECERWHLHHMGNGYYVITNHDSGLSLEGSSNNSESNTTGVVQWERTGSGRQLWRFVPADATVEFEAPDTPTGLQTSSQSGSIVLTWTANTEEDILGYMVYRYNESAGIWETIGRQVEGTEFVDNICAKGKTYKYRIRAVDQAWNISLPSNEVNGITNEEQALMGHWSFIKDLNDNSENKLHAVSTGITHADNDTHAGAVFDGNDDYISLPYHVGDMKSMTFSAWVKVGNTKTWQRIFDFGKNNDNYLFLTPSNGSHMRFEICKNGEKQGLNATRRISSGTWTHVVVSMDDTSVKLYIDGKLNAETSEISLRPSDIAPTVCYLGRSMFSSDPLFTGTIGDVRLYNYALPANEIEGLYYKDQITSATELAKSPMYKTYSNTLIEAITEAEKAIESGVETDITSALRTLNNAMNRAKTSIEAYAPLGEAIQWSKKMATDYPQNDVEALSEYETALSIIETDYLNGEYPHSKISSQITEVKAITNSYLMADAVANASELRPKDITHLIENPDFANNTLDGWTITTNESNYKGAVAHNCFEVWNHTFTLSQVLYGMPSGTYRLKAQAFYRNGTKDNSGSEDVNAMIYINSTTNTISSISRGANASTSRGDWYEYATNKNVPNDMEAASAAFTVLKRYQPTNKINAVTATYDSEAISKLTIGLKKSIAVNDDWTIVKKFQLQYLGSPETTGINSIKNADEEEKEMFDLTGRRISDDTQRKAKGVYIMNGKKIFVK